MVAIVVYIPEILAALISVGIRHSELQKTRSRFIKDVSPVSVMMQGGENKMK